MNYCQTNKVVATIYTFYISRAWYNNDRQYVYQTYYRDYAYDDSNLTKPIRAEIYS